MPGLSRRAALAGGLTACLPAWAAPAQVVEFVALGDMPYGPDWNVGPAWHHLIGQVNDTGLPFAIHVGDFKEGTAECSDEAYTQALQNFQRFSRALVYTPGDNDWIDCQRRGDNPLERLAALRKRFFGQALSLGQRPIPVQRQADVMPAHQAYVENLRWQHQGVLFATFHTVGPENGLDATEPAWLAEAQAREAANADWIRAAFELARAQGAKALVLATQAETLHYEGRDKAPKVGPSFKRSITEALLPLAERAPFPVLLIHGDDHHYKVDQTFRNPAGQRITNLWRLQVFGAPRMHAVRVRIAPGQPVPFSFEPIWNPMSADPSTKRSAAR